MLRRFLEGDEDADLCLLAVEYPAQFVDVREVPRSNPSLAYRQQLNAEGSPSGMVAEGWAWTPGTELTALVAMGAGPDGSGIGKGKTMGRKI